MPLPTDPIINVIHSIAIYVQIFKGISAVNSTPTNSVFSAQILAIGKSATITIPKITANAMNNFVFIGVIYNFKLYKCCEKRT